jgi:DNA polymerase
MDIITIDFETYYDRDYSLSKMTTESYIRDERFEIIGMAIKVNDTPTRWYKNVHDALASVDMSNSCILAHNTIFDGSILSWHYNINPKFWLDTMSMARPLHNATVGCSLASLSSIYKVGKKGTEVINALGKREKDFTPKELEDYANYCINDVELTYKLFKILVKDFPKSELKVIDQTIRMYTEPHIELDKKLLCRHAEKIKSDKHKLVDSLATKIGASPESVEKILSSNNMFAKILKKLGVEPPKKIYATTGKETYAFAKTDKQLTSLSQHDNPIIRELVGARLNVKSTIEQTRAENLINVSDRGRLPILLNYYGAHTGRFSGGDKLNLQNLPRNGAIRKALTVPKDKMLIACDSSQIEARMVAYISGQKDLVQAFKEGRDVYSEFASEIYGRKITKEDKLERFVGKTCILGLGYGMGAVKFKDTLALGQGGMSVDIDINEAQRIVNLYRQKNHMIVIFWGVCDYALRGILHNRKGSIHDDMLEYDSRGILLPNGLRIRYPKLRRTDNGFEYISNSRTYKKLQLNGTLEDKEWTKIYGGKVTENIVQALARLVISEQMVKLGKTHKVLFQVHDELILLADAKNYTKTQKHVETIMSTPPSWAGNLPVACESGVGNNYGDCK